ncbi:hypothetical protein MNAN1_001819 [Malassezia nana]|uniref:Peptidase S49 domain-containing protein n=1 Tax=Malassezia nana TaxID=180528 RepID=A0AAF0J799_9BASI|nr:hypothetical protein MNAN1_001819 [Malassezia nana]
MSMRQQQARERIEPGTYLLWRLYDGAVVETRQPDSLQTLLAQASTKEPPPVLELREAILAIHAAKQDPRIRGIVANFSGLDLPKMFPRTPLSLAQVEELMHALKEFQMAKKAQFQDDAPSTVAWTDTFDRQTSYLLASTFERVYMQPTGSVPLVGLQAQLPFVRRLLSWLGVRVHSETRKELKSMTSMFVHDELPSAQLANYAEMLGDMQRHFARYLGQNRFKRQGREAATDRAVELMQEGPYTAREALAAGLIDETLYHHEHMHRLASAPHKSLAQYARMVAKASARSPDPLSPKVAFVYMDGTIDRLRRPLSASDAMRGLREAAQQSDVDAMVLRINSGGGDVVTSESLWALLQDVRVRTQRPIVVSFGSVGASGAYYAATAADAIFANQSTLTGSIGVALMRPTITQGLLDKLLVNVQGLFTGSSALSPLHELSASQLQRVRRNVDETYEDFLLKVQEGRGLSRDVLDRLAGGRVMTGMRAWLECLPEASRARRPRDDACVYETTTFSNASGVPLTAITRQSDADALAAHDVATLDARQGHGKGLIDQLGGLWDAARYAAALAQVRNEPHDDTTTRTIHEPTLVRFPAEPPLWKRLQSWLSDAEAPISPSANMPWLAWVQWVQATYNEWLATAMRVRAETAVLTPM